MSNVLATNSVIVGLIILFEAIGSTADLIIVGLTA